MNTRVFLVLLVLAMTGIWTFGLVKKPVTATAPSQFALIYEPVGVAASGDRLQ